MLDNPEDDVWIVRRRRGGGFIVASVHPVLGAVYWCLVNESEVNLPDHAGLTPVRAQAHRFRPSDIGQVTTFQRRILNCNISRFDDGMGPVEEPVEDFVMQASGAVTAAALADWLITTLWVRIDLPVCCDYLKNLLGGWGDRPTWTARPGAALHITRADLAQWGEWEDARLARDAAVVPLRDALAAGSAGAVNHALEADAAWTLHLLIVPRLAHASLWQDRALQHAARAGMADGGDGAVSDHIAFFPELLAAFDTGRALRHCLRA